MTEEKLYLNLKPRYNFTCWNCGKEQSAAPSMFMSNFQMNLGGGFCTNPDCKVQLLLTIDDKNKSMACNEHTKENLDKFSTPVLPDACYAPLEIVKRDRQLHGK